MMLDAGTLQGILDEIERNQQAFVALGHPCSPWKLRRQYRLCKANEPLFALLGISHPPMWIDTSDSLYARWLRR